MKKLIFINIVTGIVAFAAVFLGILTLFNMYGSFAIVDTAGKQQFTMPFTTQSTADEAALKNCGQGCKAVRLVRVR